MAEQIDWIRLEDHRAALRRLLESSAERIGVAELAHQLGEEPSTIRNQLAYRERKRPSADLAHLCWLLDPEYRRLKVGLLGEVLSRPSDLTPEEALREATASAQARGYIDARDLAAILARTRRAESAEAAQPLRVAR